MFKDFYTIVVFPYLHQTKINLKLSGKRVSDSNILATKLINDRILIVLESFNIFTYWDIKSGKLIG